MPKEIFTIEYDTKGSYRILCSDGAHGEWTQYANVATMMWKGRKLVAFSHYWNGCGAFDMCNVFEVQRRNVPQEEWV